jgi:hypothetical protein
VLDLDRLRQMDAAAWFAFLRDEYSRWKYTAANRYGSTTKALRCFVEAHGLEALDQYRKRLLALAPGDTAAALKVAAEIPGLGIAGGSGLLRRARRPVARSGDATVLLRAMASVTSVKLVKYLQITV